MTFYSFDSWLWQLFFILIAGWLATDAWRFFGVYLGGRVTEDSEILVFVRTLATALVAAVIGNLIVFPSGALAVAPLGLRLISVLVGFIAYLLLGKRIIIGIIVAEALLIGGLYAIGFQG